MIPSLIAHGGFFDFILYFKDVISNLLLKVKPQWAVTCDWLAAKLRRDDDVALRRTVVERLTEMPLGPTGFENTYLK